MSTASLPHLLPGPFNFLSRDVEELRFLFPDLESALPSPMRIYLEDEGATPLVGYPILATPELEALDRSAEQYVIQEEEVMLAVDRRTSFDSALYAASWERYRLLLARATENVTTASYGRHYPAIFWLHHSLVLARVFRDAPKRLLRRDLSYGRERGDEVKYRVLQKVLDRVLGLTYDLANRLSSDTEEMEEELFPALITRMRDNVLILSEDHISPNLAELGSYFGGCLRLDGRDFRTRLVALTEWYASEVRSDPELKRLAHLLGLDLDGDPRLHLNRPGFVSYIAGRDTYTPARFFSPHQIQVWESLLVKLKEFELLHSLRRMIVAIDRDGERLVARDRVAGKPTSTPGAPRLSVATRPLDFMAPWVVDPLVSRFGLIYDISDFSEIVTTLRRSGAIEQDRSFRHMFRFQRKINRIAYQNRAKLEKYLGDGAFFSAREARQLLILAAQIQRAYRDALEQGLPFNKGLRIALNHGQYRLLPVQPGAAGEADRYEFFGHGVVELMRLTSGKSSREIEEIKNLLVVRGYSETEVNRFFAPMFQQGADFVDRREEARQFHAYINSNGTLVNEGIVATGDFVRRLGSEGVYERVFRLADEHRSYVAIKLDLQGGSLLVGIRRLGVAHLKGLDRLPVYELVDATMWTDNTLVELRKEELYEQIEREFASGLGH